MREDGLTSRWTVGRLRGAVAVPSGWQLERLADVSTLESGHTPARTNPAYWNGHIPWVSLHDTSALSFGEILDTKLMVTSEGISNSSARVLPKGTVALSRTATVGKAVLFGREMATSQDFACFLPSERVETRYLLHLFKCMAPEWRRLSAGSTHQTIYMPIFKRLQVLLPPLPEQRRIAEILDTIDETIQATERVIAKLERVRSGLAHSLIGAIEAPRTRLREVASLASGSTPSRSRNDYWNGSVPWVKTGEVRGNVIDRTEELITDRALAECPLEVYPVGTVLVAMYGQGTTRGRVSMLGVPATTNQACAAVQSSPDVLGGSYLFEVLKYSYHALRALSQGSHQENLSTRLIGDFELPVPPLAEQTRVVAVLDSASVRLEAEEAELKKVHEARAGLADDLLSGRMRTVVV